MADFIAANIILYYTALLSVMRRIILVPLHVGLHVACRHQTHLMPEL